jgi:small subunit ribosomal protein S1
MDDFSAALAAFEQEQAAEAAAVEAYGDKVVSGTVLKQTEKHLVVDVGLKSEGLVPLEQVLDHTGAVKFQPGDVIDVVIEREEPEGGYLVSYERAQRLRVWDTIEKAANDKTPVMGTVVSRVKGGLTVDIGLKAFLPGSQLEIRPVRNLDGYLGQQIEVRVIKLNKKRGNVVVSRKEILEEEQTAKRSTTLEQLAEGAILTGTVKNLTDYGAFVDMGGIELGPADAPARPGECGRRNPGEGAEVRQGKAAGFSGLQAVDARPVAGRHRALSGGRACAWPRSLGHRLRRVCRTGAGHRGPGSSL